MQKSIQPIYLFADSGLLFWQQGDALFLDSIRALLTADRPKAAYIGASNDDNPDFFEIFKAAMAQVGITDCRMILSTYSREDAAFLEQADLILLAGGDVEAGWLTIEETGMARVIFARHREGAVLIGTSAGAVQLGLYGYRQDGSSSCELFETLKLVPFLVDTHDERNDWSRLEDIVGMLDNDVMGIGIPAGCGVIRHPNGDLEPIRSYVDLFFVKEGQMERSALSPQGYSPRGR